MTPLTMTLDAPPCARCGTTGGRPHNARLSDAPGRALGRRFGIEGRICLKCYDKLDYEQRSPEHGSYGARGLLGETAEERREIRERIALVRADSVIPRYAFIARILAERFPMEFRPVRVRLRTRNWMRLI